MAAKMSIIRGESGRLYDEFRERGVVTIGCRNGSRSQTKYVAKGNSPAVSADRTKHQLETSETKRLFSIKRIYILCLNHI